MIELREGRMACMRTTRPWRQPESYPSICATVADFRLGDHGRFVVLDHNLAGGCRTSVKIDRPGDTREHDDAVFHFLCCCVGRHTAGTARTASRNVIALYCSCDSALGRELGVTRQQR